MPKKGRNLFYGDEMRRFSEKTMTGAFDAHGSRSGDRCLSRRRANPGNMEVRVIALTFLVLEPSNVIDE